MMCIIKKETSGSASAICVRFVQLFRSQVDIFSFPRTSPHPLSMPPRPKGVTVRSKSLLQTRKAIPHCTCPPPPRSKRGTHTTSPPTVHSFVPTRFNRFYGTTHSAKKPRPSVSCPSCHYYPPIPPSLGLGQPVHVRACVCERSVVSSSVSLPHMRTRIQPHPRPSTASPQVIDLTHKIKPKKEDG